MDTTTRRPATWDDLTIGATCYKGQGLAEWVVIARGEHYSTVNPDLGWPWVAVSKATSQAGIAARSTGKPQHGKTTMQRLDVFTVRA